MKKKKLFTLIFCILALVIIMLFLWNSKILENKKNTASIATKEECVKANVNEYMDLNKFLKFNKFIADLSEKQDFFIIYFKNLDKV